MQITVNGQTREVPDNFHAEQLIEMLELTGKRLAMEVNQEILPRSEFGCYQFKHGDVVEIVHAIGGG